MRANNHVNEEAGSVNGAIGNEDQTQHKPKKPWSFKMQTWARRQEVHPRGARHLLLVLVSYADERGTCYPSKATLACDCGVEKSTICLDLRALKKVERWPDANDLVSWYATVDRECAEQGNLNGAAVLNFAETRLDDLAQIPF